MIAKVFGSTKDAELTSLSMRPMIMDGAADTTEATTLIMTRIPRRILIRIKI